jgi:ATP-dependent DNA helicase RecQ
VGPAAADILHRHFGYTGFRPGQEALIGHLLAGGDCLGVMPTGAGKSLCYQVPGCLLPGLTLVVSPLISLMKDQVASLDEAGIPAAFINSSQSQAEQSRALRRLQETGLRLLYVAPERLQSPSFQQGIAGIPVSLVAVDEAHCVSQWGHDFRPSYREIPRFIESLALRPAVGAFTATATEQVREDIITLLKLREPLVQVSGFDRPNLRFEVRKVKASDKMECLKGFLMQEKADAGASGIVYCATRKTVEEVCAVLCEAGLPATRYHAGLSDSERRANQDDFVFDRKPLMVATNAFGMGIDKSNVNFTVHYNMPLDLESYYQEAGRAGRDGSPATCLLLYAPADVRLGEFLITHGERDPEHDVDVRFALQAKAFELLRQMTYYATTNDCLRRYILRYFGEPAKVSCGNCSNCSTAFEEADVTLDAQKVVSCVFRLREKGRSMGKAMVAAILRGSREKRLLDLGFDQLSTYGIMASSQTHHIRVIIDLLVEQGYLVLTAGEFPTLQWSSRTRELLAPGAQIRLRMPKQKPATTSGIVKKETGRQRSTGTRYPVSPSDAACDSSKLGDTVPELRPPGSRAEEDIGDEAQAALFADLRELRTEIAREQNLPAYLVFSDASLREMARVRPYTEEGLLSVQGVGAVKLERYGRRFLACIKRHGQAEGDH